MTRSRDVANIDGILTTTGDTFYASAAATPARLGVGSTGQVLTVAGGVPTWATPAGGGGFTSLASGTLSGSNIDLTSISGSYKDLRLVLSNYYISTAGNIQMTLNNLSGGSDYFSSSYNTNNANSAAPTFKYQGSGGYCWLVQDQNCHTAANMRNVMVIDFPDYARTTNYKSIRNSYWQQSGASTWAIGWDTYIFAQTTAISRITVKPESTRTWSGGTYELLGAN